MFNRNPRALVNNPSFLTQVMNAWTPVYAVGFIAIIIALVCFHYAPRPAHPNYLLAVGVLALNVWSYCAGLGPRAK